MAPPSWVSPRPRGSQGLHSELATEFSTAWITFCWKGRLLICIANKYKNVNSANFVVKFVPLPQLRRCLPSLQNRKEGLAHWGMRCFQFPLKATEIAHTLPREIRTFRNEDKIQCMHNSKNQTNNKQTKKHLCGFIVFPSTSIYSLNFRLLFLMWTVFLAFCTTYCL